MPISSLYRLDDTTWSTATTLLQSGIGEIRITTPQFDTGTKAYQLSSMVQNVISKNLSRIDRATLRRGFVITNKSGPLKRTWFVSSRKRESTISMIFHRVLTSISRWLTFTQEISSEKIITVYAEELSHHRCRKLVGKMVCSAQYSGLHEQEKPLVSGSLPATAEEQLHTEAFCDRYTLLATDCLQKDERNFVMEAKHRGQFRYCIKNGNLLLEKVGNSSPEEREENRVVWASYRRFLELEFGKEFVDYIRVAYNIDFAGMEQNGLPLYPDHIFKCNIGANNIELSHVERLWGVIKGLAQQQRSPTLEGYAEQLSMRVVRKLVSRCGSLDHVHEYLKQFVEENNSLSVRDLPPARFNDIVTLFWPTDEERRHSFTGREIRHLAIEGFHTMGDLNIPNACRNLFELQHIFHDLARFHSPEEHYEVLSHVASKKELFRQTPSQVNRWHVGILVPGLSPDGSQRWDVNSLFFDDGEGDVHYVFEPACNSYRTSNDTECRPSVTILPRSTASNRYAVNWFDSIRADMNHHSPGMLNPDRAYFYEKKFFEDRTIPVWVGLLLAAKKNASSPLLLKRAVDAFSVYIHEKSPRDEALLPHLKNLLANEKYNELMNQLFQHAESFHERPEDKIRQAIVLAGHSLGGTNSYILMCNLFADHQRFPLPGLDVSCFSYNAPGIDREQASAFMKYGREYSDILQAQGSSFRVFQQFERRDIVPEFGGDHIGTGSTKGDTWLQLRFLICNALKGAEALSVTTLPAHARRFSTAEKGRDYECLDLGVDELTAFDRGIRLTQELRRKFGLPRFFSPKANEATRKLIGAVLSLPLRIIDRFIDYRPPNPDQKGVVALVYNGPASSEYCVRDISGKREDEAHMSYDRLRKIAVAYVLGVRNSISSIAFYRRGRR